MRLRAFSRVPAILAAVLVSGVAPGQPPAKPGVAATVNGEAIPLDAVDAFIAGKLSLPPLTPAQRRQLRHEVAADMVDDLLVKQFLRRHGPKIDPAELDGYFKAFTASLARRGKTFADYLKETAQTEAAVCDTWTTLLQLNGYVKQHVPDAQLKTYYLANKDHFDRVEVKVSHIVVRVGPSAPATEKAAAREKLRALRGDIAAGKLDFAAAAKKYSQSASAAAGGDLGYIPRKGGLVDEAFAKAAFSLKVGEVCDVVESDDGLHLIEITDRKAGTPSTFEACVDDVRDAFAEDFRAELVAKLRKEARVQITLP